MFLIALIAISKVPKVTFSWLVYTQICKHKMQVIQCILIRLLQGLADIFYTETVTGAAVQGQSLNWVNSFDSGRDALVLVIGLMDRASQNYCVN